LGAKRVAPTLLADFHYNTIGLNKAAHCLLILSFSVQIIHLNMSFITDT